MLSRLQSLGRSAQARIHRAKAAASGSRRAAVFPHRTCTKARVNSVPAPVLRNAWPSWERNTYEGGIHNFLPGFPAVSARAALQGVRESPDDAMAVWARQLIDQLNRTEVEPVEEMEPEPFFEVVDTSDEPGDYNLEINLVRAPSWTLAQLEAWVSPRI